MQHLPVFIVSGLAVFAALSHAQASFAQSRIQTSGKIYPHSSEKSEDETKAEPSAPSKTLAESNSEAEAESTTQQAERPQGPPIEQGGRLDLICGGTGAANKIDQVDGYGSFSGSVSNYGRHIGDVSGSTNMTITGTRRDGFGDQVALFIEDGEGRLRMPKIMLPPIRGGEDGWFKLNKIKIKENEITASISVNPFNNPKMRVDRYTGAISISGKAGDYIGQCQRFVPEETQKQF
ncbi:hypothetical protein [Qipengyuania nanhaisediminis]|uniref:Secreted protein n=1 Tax=Qipengyuania nanhaisediminis TaxID=604088 RepID=A0A1I5LA40_9SPHN|nr:hypothetical protein [Qipengyuania nanhaisediminis]SFO94150.1 hypothetical protein SAMN04488060_0859 [Qipengyuania nanhaisediminis]